MVSHLLEEKMIIFLFKKDLLFVVSPIVDMINVTSTEFHTAYS